jgi:hypothetical protein
MALPITGCADLLETLSPFVPDDHLNELLPRHRGAGRRNDCSAAQLYRVLLLLLLTPARSSNLLCWLLPEQRAWRKFAHLPNRQSVPGPRQLHEFRSRLTVGVLREVNERLLQRVLEGWPQEQLGVALMDATDLPAATNEYTKKTRPRFFCAQSGAGRTHEKDRAIALVYRLQKTHPAALVSTLHGIGFTRAIDDMGCPGQSW